MEFHQIFHETFELFLIKILIFHSSFFSHM